MLDLQLDIALTCGEARAPWHEATARIPHLWRPVIAGATVNPGDDEDEDEEEDGSGKGGGNIEPDDDEGIGDDDDEDEDEDDQDDTLWADPVVSDIAPHQSSIRFCVSVEEASY